MWSGSGGGAGLGLHAPRGGDFNDERCGEHGREARPPPRSSSLSPSVRALSFSLSQEEKRGRGTGPTHQHTTHARMWKYLWSGWAHVERTRPHAPTTQPDTVQHGL